MARALMTIFRNSMRVKVLAYVLRAGVPSTALQISKGIRSSRAAAEREARALARVGAIVARPARRTALRGRMQYVVNALHPLTPHLRTLLTEAMNPSDRDIIGAFRKVPGVLLLIAAGALADDDRGGVDLLIVVKNPHSARVPRAVARVESLSGLPLRYAVMSAEEYGRRRQSFNRMLRDVLDFSHRILVMRLPKGSDAPLA